MYVDKPTGNHNVSRPSVIGFNDIWNLSGIMLAITIQSDQNISIELASTLKQALYGSAIAQVLLVTNHISSQTLSNLARQIR